MSRAVNAFCGMFWPMSETFRRKNYGAILRAAAQILMIRPCQQGMII